ncbi:DNA polymerase III alpha subunit (gram-positive type) [Novosphingobium chloroacetimidivorans]|uniref:DNA polymerase III alpha subunit (Gram-positive type) n=1 Tax=Novosphingobium chloroacetimidivorans TaxID=1428314 RepID=A0A7W7NXP1_9SPHN|nr:3'-5' exonuclease [Novosphingobium chloroacetimidivorans]MBB4859669.1 DNA polymerase III alpha subunit (gram-positive type) [Novosphingobium chloroacetimidivorans]
MYLVFDTETTGLPLWNDPSDDPRQPHIVDLACSLYDAVGVEIERYDVLINAGVEIPDEVVAIHGITTEMTQEQGVEPAEALDNFLAMVAKAVVIVGHNVSFDLRMKRILAARVLGEKWDCPKPSFCTMRKTTGIVKKLKAKPRFDTDWKWPTLGEATEHFFAEPHTDAHRARPDADASARIFFHLKERGLA